MATWLFKTEPSDYTYGDLVRDRRTVWDGVGNALALQHLRKVRRGDEAFIYHTGGERRIVGLARVLSEPYADPAAQDPRRAVVDVEPLRALDTPVTLAAIKAEAAFATFDLVRNARLSVMPVPEALRRRILSMSA